MLCFSNTALKLFKSNYLSKLYFKPIIVISSLNYNTFNYKKFNEKRYNYKKLYSAFSSFSLIGVVVAYYYFYNNNNNKIKNKYIQVYAFNKPQNKEKVTFGVKKNDLPTYSMEQVSKHDNPKTGIWITFKEGVYDITNFVTQHPGGQSKIMMAAGGSIDPFWIVFANHNKTEILELLESMRIGNLKSEDVYKSTGDTFDPYALEPTRSKLLKINGKQPFCAEPPSPLLVENFKTPVDLFYIRNHLPVPFVSKEDYELELSIENEKIVKTLTFDDIKKYPKYTVTSAIMCGGNRRSEMSEEKPLRGLSWSVGAIGNASWSGARLCDVLEGLEIKEEDYNHVQFEGMDQDPAGIPYGASIPIFKAFDPRADVILAYEMNEELIPLDHGFPIRVIVPGVVGARNVKWLNKIIFSKNESLSQFQQNDYKGFSPSIDWHNVDFSKAPAIQELPVTSAICVPQKGDKVTINNGTIKIKGYAWSGGGNKIIRVDVTADEGETWHVAELTNQDKNAKEGRNYAWTLWNLDLPVDKSKSHVEIWAKAVDSSYNVQPESFKNIWNLRGFLCNAYHKVKIELK